MNKNTAIVLGVIVVLAVIGAIVYTNQGPVTPSTTDTTTSSTDTNTTGNTAGNTNGQTIPPANSPQPSAPKVVTSPSTVTSDTTAIVTGSVVPNGTFTTYWYEYGTTASYGSKTTNQLIGSGYASIAAPGYITGLPSCC